MMGGDLIPRAIEMAREVRRGEAKHSPAELHKHSLGRADIYRHAMREAGYVVPSVTMCAPAICDVCRYDFGTDTPIRPSSKGQDGWALSLDDPSLSDEERAAIEWCIGKRKKAP
jgi:hypothetical protein